MPALLEAPVDTVVAQNSSKESPSYLGLGGSARPSLFFPRAWLRVGMPPRKGQKCPETTKSP